MVVVNYTRGMILALGVLYRRLPIPHIDYESLVSRLRVRPSEATVSIEVAAHGCRPHAAAREHDDEDASDHEALLQRGHGAPFRRVA
jgi:hypothetical protein